MTEHVWLPIGGMIGPTSVGHVTSALRRVRGVGGVKVDLGSATVAFDPSRTSMKAIVVAIRKAGYEPMPDQAQPFVPKGRGGIFGWLGLR